MDNRFFQAFGGVYLISIDILLVLGVIYFFKLANEKRVNSYYWLPFLILSFTVTYENIGAFSLYNSEFNTWVNSLLGNTEFPRYNLWIYNIGNRQIATVLYLFLIKSWLEPSKKKYINWMIIFFIVMIQILQFTGLEPIYLSQPIIFAIGANMILVASGLYFIGLITNDRYIESNPLKLLSFWQMTFILFTYSLTYINSVALLYLWEVNRVLANSLHNIDWIMSLSNLSILVLTIASPRLTTLFETEPYYESK